MGPETSCLFEYPPLQLSPRIGARFPRFCKTVLGRYTIHHTLEVLLQNRSCLAFRPLRGPACLDTLSHVWTGTTAILRPLGQRLRDSPPTKRSLSGTSSILYFQNARTAAQPMARRAFVGQLRVLTHGVSVKPFTPVVKRVTKDAARAGAGAVGRRTRQLRLHAQGGSPSPRSGPASLDAAPSPPYPPAPEGQPSPRGQPARPAE